MGWRMIGKPIETAEIGVLGQDFILDESQVIKGITIGLIFYNDPTFTSINLKIKSPQGQVIATSLTSYTKAECLAGGNSSYRVMGFEFNETLLQASTAYRLVVDAAAYTAINSSYIAYRSSYPDPQYPRGITLNAAKGVKHPFEFSIISGDI